jgi:hypothetical protein
MLHAKVQKQARAGLDEFSRAGRGSE